VAVRSTTWVRGHSPAEIVRSNPAGVMDVYLSCVVLRQVQVYTTGRSPTQRSPTDCGASLCVIWIP